MQPVHSDRAPAAVGPYSQAIVCGGMLYTSGQIALDPDSGNMVGEDVGTQTRQVLKNLQAVLNAAGCTQQNIVKATIYLTDMADFSEVNTIYAEWLGSHRPARSTVQVAALPLQARVEIDLVACLR
ncbi:MAG: RidA family protein [Zetaproteobacteria bacterium]|nr:MAG: RidA family protein [Zetaproteobacteria bacterium]